MSAMFTSGCQCALSCLGTYTDNYAAHRKGVLDYQIYNSPRSFGFTCIGIGVSALAYSLFRMYRKEKGEENDPLLPSSESMQKQRAIKRDLAPYAFIAGTQILAGSLFLLMEYGGNVISCDLRQLVTTSWDTCNTKCASR